MNPISKICRRIRARVMYARAVSDAEAQRAAGNGRQYVVLHTDDGGRIRLIVVDRRNFRLLKRKHYLPDTATMADLEREAVYYTAHNNGSAPLAPAWAALRRAQFITAYAKKEA